MGRRTGVLTVALEGAEKASIYFDSGEMTHAEFGSTEGAPVIYQLFRKQDGSFQFASGITSSRRTIHHDWMSIVMEAARRFDEEGKQGDEGDWIEEEVVPEETPLPADLAATKRKLIEVLDQAFGKKAKRIRDELDKIDADGDKLMEFCEKAEKYIFVFIDNKRAKEVAERMRNIVRADRFS
jgi:hypothetical protein